MLSTQRTCLTCLLSKLPSLQGLWPVPEQDAFSTYRVGFCWGSLMPKRPGAILFCFATETWKENQQVQLQSNQEHL